MVSDEPSSSSVVSSCLPLHHALAEEVREAATAAANLVDNLADKFSEDTSKGLSLLELKNHVMLDYLANLSQVMLAKASGRRLEGSGAVERLVTDRTVLEKLRPIEQKLKYQIGKALKVAEGGEIRPDDPLHFKANPSALVGKLDDEGDDSDEEEDEAGGDDGEEGKDKKYVAPKHVPAYYDEDVSKEDREREAEGRRKKQQLSRGLIEDLKRQHLETPEEIYEQEDVMRKKNVQAIKERIRYEEENFMRLPLTKKQKHARRQMSTVGTLADEVTSFGRSHFSEASKGRKRKSGGGFKKGSAKKKFRK